MDSYTIKMHVSWYQSIGIVRIVLPVKFDGRLSISVLRNEQLFTKNWGSKTEQFLKSSNFQTFQTPPFGKSPLYISNSLCGVSNPVEVALT
jgi:hypothetical protein